MVAKLLLANHLFCLFIQYKMSDRGTFTVLGLLPTTLFWTWEERNHKLCQDMLKTTPNTCANACSITLSRLKLTRGGGEYGIPCINNKHGLIKAAKSFLLLEFYKCCLLFLSRNTKSVKESDPSNIPLPLDKSRRGLSRFSQRCCRHVVI